MAVGPLEATTDGEAATAEKKISVKRVWAATDERRGDAPLRLDRTEKSRLTAPNLKLKNQKRPIGKRKREGREKAHCESFGSPALPVLLLKNE